MACSRVTLGKLSKNSCSDIPSSRFDSNALTGTRVCLKTGVPLTMLARVLCLCVRHKFTGRLIHWVLFTFCRSEAQEITDSMAGSGHGLGQQRAREDYAGRAETSSPCHPIISNLQDFYGGDGSLLRRNRGDLIRSPGSQKPLQWSYDSPAFCH